MRQTAEAAAADRRKVPSLSLPLSLSLSLSLAWPHAASHAPQREEAEVREARLQEEVRYIRVMWG